MTPSTESPRTSPDPRTPWSIRPATTRDADELLALLEAVAGEGKWIGTQAGFDRVARLAHMRAMYEDPDRFTGFAVVAGAAPPTPDADAGDPPVSDAGAPDPPAPDAGATIVGMLGLETPASGLAELGMMLLDGWRGLGLGSLLMTEAVERASEAGMHKIALQVWPHNQAGRALYRKFGFVEEGRLVRHYRRLNGELWDVIAMGLVLDTTSPGSPFPD